MLEEIQKTDSWAKLIKNPKFEEEFKKTVNNYSINLNELTIESYEDTIIITYNGAIRNRDLDCQIKDFERTIFSFDEEDNLVINELNGKLESNYGSTFNTTNGGIYKTHYSTRVFDNDGIELGYQSYGDKYHLDIHEFKDYATDLQRVTLGAFNPNLRTSSNVTGVYPHPNIIGRDGRFVRHIRSKDNLGIVEVTRCLFDDKATIKSVQEEYYFNTFFVSPSKLHPELIHIVNGFPFAKINEDNQVVISNDYIALGLTKENYKDVARDRFKKELLEEKQSIQYDSDTLARYNLVLERLDNEEKKTKRIH